MEHLVNDENKWYIKIWCDAVTGKKFNTISIQWDESFDGKWEWEGNEHVVEIRELTEKEFLNQY